MSAAGRFDRLRHGRSREPPADQMEPRLAGEVAIGNSDEDVEMAVRG
jgi:hypothetical protein